MVQQHNPSGTTGGATDRAGLSRGLVTTLVGVGLLVVFVAQNRQDVTLTFLVWSFSWPLWLFTVVAAVLGALVWMGLGVLRRHRRRVARRAARGD
ncbi:lipopolysaccharide assembly protein LapA domain-containing protein [Puerhibacterium puerhi]|uniref:lipopolysaccharide assembly protein LapA domain-containing protein n=1 Tax=Puerhibacterium puerhi TaxID=2692623 RepID=UPI00135ADD06|nr:LapA family protein [Puerhibacterium puerhi]